MMRHLPSLSGVILLLGMALAGVTAHAQTAGTEAHDSVAAQIQQLRDVLAAQQKQIAEQQAKIDALTNELQLQQEHAAASTTNSLPGPLPQETKPPQQSTQASDSIVLSNGKLKIGAVAYADWSVYQQTGFGPAFLDTPHNYPGPGNDGYNAFNLNRTYINLLYSPADWVTFRVTPDIYRDVNGAGGQKLGAISGAGATPNGSLNFRLKYGYAEFARLFSGAFKDDNVRLGQQMNPMIDWEEGLYGYRFTSLVPWNFISLSSTYTGVSLNGPIRGSNGKQYLEYQIGVFNNSNFHQYELAETKTVMARASLYPFGASSKYQGLGLTGFVDYGYNNAAPDTDSQTPVVRTSALIHYQSPHNGGQIAFEYMLGRNAFSTGNLFGGSAPLDLLSLGTTSYANLTKLASAVLAGRSTQQQGFSVFGHINIPKSKWAAFVMYQFFQPNTNIPSDPLDFHRAVAGLSYALNKNVRFAFDTQNVLYRHRQFTYPAATLATWNPTLAASSPGGIPNAVPPSVKALFLNMEFSF